MFFYPRDNLCLVTCNTAGVLIKYVSQILDVVKPMFEEHEQRDKRRPKLGQLLRVPGQQQRERSDGERERDEPAEESHAGVESVAAAESQLVRDALEHASR